MPNVASSPPPVPHITSKSTWTVHSLKAYAITETKTEQTDLENGLPGKVAGGQSQASEEKMPWEEGGFRHIEN